jgi:hypothetical protein
MNDLNMSPSLTAIKRKFIPNIFHNLIGKSFYVLLLLPRLDSIYEIRGNLSSTGTESHHKEKPA